MKNGAGKKILDEAVFAGLPLGADPAQVRAEQDKDKDDGEECETPGQKKRSGGKGKGLGKGGGRGPLGTPSSEGEEDGATPDGEATEIPHQALVTFQSFYIEGKYEEAAKAAAEALGIGESDDPMEVDEEKVRAEWARCIAEQESKFNFLRKSMLKFNTFLGTAKGSWDGLSDKQKESAVKFLKSKASKMSSELKSLLGGLTEKSPADKVLMAAMLAYMFGVGMSGEGAIAGESDGE